MTTVLDPSLAHNGGGDVFLPEQFAMVGPFKTSDVTLAAGTNFAKYTAVGIRADGKCVPVDVSATDVRPDVKAQGALTFAANPAANDTVTINGQAITFVSGVPSGAQVQIGATTALTAANLLAYINATPATGVTANGTGSVLALEAITAGSAGNSITLAKSATNPAVSAATLTGGNTAFAVQASEAKVFGIVAQPVDATSADQAGQAFIMGTYNHEVIVWPASLANLAQRRAACAGTPLWMDAPLGAV